MVVWVKVVAEAMTLVGVVFFNLENCGKIFLTNFYYLSFSSTIQWHCIHPQCYATIITIHFYLSHHPKEKLWTH